VLAAFCIATLGQMPAGKELPDFLKETFLVSDPIGIIPLPISIAF
jgi:hypothetical protein